MEDALPCTGWRAALSPSLGCPPEHGYRGGFGADVSLTRTEQELTDNLMLALSVFLVCEVVRSRDPPAEAPHPPGSCWCCRDRPHHYPSAPGAPPALRPHASLLLVSWHRYCSSIPAGSGGSQRSLRPGSSDSWHNWHQPSDHSQQAQRLALVSGSTTINRQSAWGHGGAIPTMGVGPCNFLIELCGEVGGSRRRSLDAEHWEG